MAQSQSGKLAPHERQVLLQLARDAIVAAASNQSPPQPDLHSLTDTVIREAACFVTLYKGKELRGCTGTLVARMPLAVEVVHTAAQTALHDPRFLPVTPSEVAALEIEISVLTTPSRLELDTPTELPARIRPGVDGVTLYRGRNRATFLPQVWDKIPDPIQFLEMLSAKMGLAGDAWAQEGTMVEVYQVEEFSDEHRATS
jgi:AmmeMemoRadiSam system protein A